MNAAPRVVAAVVAALALPAAAQEAQQGTRLLRQPAVSAAEVAFSYGGDIWIAPRGGGAARRVTTFQGEETLPRFSPDGAWVAFSGQYDGNVDVYLVAAAGGEPRRLTFHPQADLVRGFTADGSRVLFASGRDGAPVPYPRWWSIAVAAGSPPLAEPLPYPRVWKGAFSASGARFAYQPIEQFDVEWRNYRGGQVRPIWIADTRSFELETPPWDGSHDTDPAWSGDDLYFLSDRDWAVNLYRWRGGALEQLTHHREFDAKNLSAGGGVLVYELGGFLHLFDPASGTDRSLTISVRGDLPWARPHWEEVEPDADTAVLSPTGKRALFVARGDIVSVPAEKGDVRFHASGSDAREIAPAWSPDGKWLSWWSDRGGRYRLMIAAPDAQAPPRAIDLPEPTFFYTPRWSPDSKHLAYTDSALVLRAVEVATGRVTRIDGDRYAHPVRSLEPAWSPDSRYLAYAKRLPNQLRAVMVYSLAEGVARPLTDGLADAWAPVWDRGGKALFFLASTNPALRTGWLDMSSFERPMTSSLYLALLRRGEPSPLVRPSDEEGEAAPAKDAAKPEGGKPADAKSKKEGGKEEKKETGDEEAKPPEVSVDWDGIGQRILAAEVPAHEYLGLLAGAPGVVFLLEGSADSGNSAPSPLALHRYQLEGQKFEPVLSGLAAATLSADGKKLLYRAGEAWGIVDASGTPKAGDGKIETKLRVRVDPRAEWRQMFDEAWRFQRDYLYVPNLHGADWEGVYRKYSPLVEHVAHRADLNYLLDLVSGELSLGHSFVFGGDLPDVPAVEIGLLGADLALEGGRYRFTRVFPGDRFDPKLRAPLAVPGNEVNAGDYLLAIDGVPLSGIDNLYARLEGKAGRKVMLQVAGDPSGKGVRTVTVEPVADETALRRQAWVEGNRRRVAERSGGRVGYLWLPNTGRAGYDAFNRDYFAQQDKEGIVIDERWNGGGSAADYMIDVLARTPMGYFNNPVGDRRPWTMPMAGIFGPKVMVINESAGSGGDLLPYLFQQKRIGPLVGTRTWGGLVGIWDVPLLLDGGLVTAPRGGFFDHAGRWSVENEGVAPDVLVEQTPKETIAGADPQLEAAVREALRLLAERPFRPLAEPPPPVRVRRPD